MIQIQWINPGPDWYVLLDVDPRKLLQAAGDTKHFEPNPRRLTAVMERLSQGGKIDAPIVGRFWITSYGVHHKGIGFTDGRHRTVAALRLGLPTIKIAVSPKEIEFVQSSIFKEQAEGAPYTIFRSDGITIECDSVEMAVNVLFHTILDGSIPMPSGK